MKFKIHNQQAELTIFVKPNARQTALVAVSDEQGMVISLHAKPHEGEANRELILFLAKLFKLPKTSIVLQTGGRSRHKKVVLPLNEQVKSFIQDPINYVKSLA